MRAPYKQIVNEQEYATLTLANTIHSTLTEVINTLAVAIENALLVLASPARLAKFQVVLTDIFSLPNTQHGTYGWMWLIDWTGRSTVTHDVNATGNPGWSLTGATNQYTVQQTGTYYIQGTGQLNSCSGSAKGIGAGIFVNDTMIMYNSDQLTDFSGWDYKTLAVGGMRDLVAGDKVAFHGEGGYGTDNRFRGSPAPSYSETRFTIYQLS